MPISERKPRREKRGLALAVIAIVSFLAFVPALHGPFVLDDISSVLKNPAIRHIGTGAEGVASAGGTRGRPVATLSFAVNYAIGGLSTEGYHAGNLLIHAAAALLLFGLVRGTLRPRLGSRADLIGFGAALIWALHPIQAETVAYIAQRTECLMGAFYLATLYALHRGALCEREKGTRPGIWYGVSVACCWLGMATKEVMITAPVMALLYDRTFLSGGFRAALKARGRVYLGMAGSWAMLAILLRGVSERGAGTGIGVSPLAYARVECGAVLHYLRVALWPNHLVFDMGAFPSVEAMGSPLATAAVSALVLATVALLVARPAAGFLAAWVLVTLSPTSSLVPIAYQPVAEHRMYLPLAALAVAASLCLARLPRRVGGLSFALIAMALGFLSFERSGLFASELALWDATVAADPQSARAHANLGQAYAHLNRSPEAEREIRESIRLDPRESEPRINLAVVLLGLGRQEEAVRSLREAIALAPRSPEAHYNLGWVLASSGHPEQSEAEYRQALTDSPDFFDAHCNLADLLLKQGRFPEAASEYEEALRLEPLDPSLHFNLAYAYVRLGQGDEAIAHFREALRIDPSLVAARRNLELLERAKR